MLGAAVHDPSRPIVARHRCNAARAGDRYADLGSLTTKSAGYAIPTCCGGSPSHNPSLTSGAQSDVGRARIGPGQTMAAKAPAQLGPFFVGYTLRPAAPAAPSRQEFRHFRLLGG